jgi:hypothetical protein
MMRMGQSAVWESDHFITNNGAITLRFSANGGARRWGAASGAPAVPHPSGGSLVANSANFLQITGITTGRYRITFNHLTAEYSFRQLYKESSGVNLLKNPGFEQTTQGDDGGDAVDWGGWQAWPKKAGDGYQPHSGKWCGAIHGRLFPEWSNYGSFAQDVAFNRVKPTAPRLGSGPRPTGLPNTCRLKSNGWMPPRSNWAATPFATFPRWTATGPSTPPKASRLPARSARMWFSFAPKRKPPEPCR